MSNNTDNVPHTFLWPSQLQAELQTSLNMNEFAERLGVPASMVTFVLEDMITQGRILKGFVPLCPVTQYRLGEYDTEDDIPDVLKCPFCPKPHDVTDITYNITYRLP